MTAIINLLTLHPRSQVLSYPPSLSLRRAGRKKHGDEVAYSYPLLGYYNVLYSDEILGGTFSSATAGPITPVRLLQLIREAPFNACSV